MLRWLTDASLADSIAGDLQEQRRAKGRLWFWRATVAIVVYCVTRKIAGSLRALLGRGPRFNRGRVWRQAARSLKRSPWYSLTAVSVLALSLTLATTVFAVVDATLFKPLPYVRPAELHLISGGYSDQVLSTPGVAVRNKSGLGLSVRDLRDIVAAAPGATFAAYASGSSGAPPVGSLRSAPPQVGWVGDHFFDVIGMHPLFGGFAPEDFDIPSSGPIPAVISYRAWQSLFGGRADVIDRTMAGATAQVSYRVVGVMPPQFVFPARGLNPDLLRPLVISPADRDDRHKRTNRFLVRLPPTVPISEYQKRFDVAAAAAAAELSDVPKQLGAGATDVFAVTPLIEQLAGRDQPTFLLVFGMAVLLVILGCVNVSSLVASHQIDRTGQLSLRRAIGAGGADIAALVLAESALIVLAGTVIGVMAAYPVLAAVRAVLPASYMLGGAPSVSWRLLGFAAIASGLCVFIVSIWPLRRGLRQAIVSALASDARTMSTRRSSSRFVIVAIQVSLGLVLTLGGALLVGSLVRVWSGNLGYEPGGLVMVEVSVDGATVNDRAVAIDAVLERVRHWPGVEAVGLTDNSMLRNSSPGGTVAFDTYAVTPGFVDAIKPALLNGRWPTPEEFASGAHVALLTPDAAAKLFPALPPIGQSIPTRNGPFTVIGIVKPAFFSAWDGIGRFPGFQSYVPHRAASSRTAGTMVIRAGRQDRALVRRMILEAPSFTAPVRITSVALATDLLTDTIKPRRFQAWLFGSFGISALAIVALGLLGLLAMATARRRREVGIRVALGATKPVIVAQFLKEQLTAVVVGLAAGAVISIWTVKLTEELLYQITVYDVRVWTVAVIAVLVVSVVGVLVPSMRASRVDPIKALRVD